MRAHPAPEEDLPAVGAAAPPAWHAWAWRAVGVVAVIFTVVFTVPWKPAVEAPIGAFDFSWMLVLHDAVATGKQFGTQIILPQGPLGFFGNNVYDPRTYGLLIVMRCLAAFTAAWALVAAGRKLIQNPFVAFAWLVAIVALIGKSADHFFPACALLLLLSYFFVDDRRPTKVSLALTLLLAASSLIKVNQPFYAVVTLGAIGVDGLARRDKRALALPLTYLGGLLAFYFAARQSPASLGHFLWGWFQVTTGHTDAVGLPGPVIDAIGFLFVITLVLTLVAIAGWKRWRWLAIFPLAGSAGVLLLIYKHSFMRQDGQHVQMGPLVATAASILFTPSVLSRENLSLKRLGWPVVWCAIVIGAAATLLASILPTYTDEGVFSSIGTRLFDNAAALVGRVTDPSRQHRDWEAARQAVRNEVPLQIASIHGTVDVYPHRQDVVFAYGLNYAPRPVISSLVATAPRLAELNLQSLRSPAAPESILFDIEPVDHNFPTILDGLSVPDLLTRYDVADASGRMLILRKTATPRPFSFTPLSSTVSTFGQSVAVPDPGDGAIWVRLHFRKRLAGKVLGMLYKPATLGMTVTVDGGTVIDTRLLPSLADEHGFLLSPVLVDRHVWATFAAGVPAQKPLDIAKSLVFFVADGDQETSFDPEVTVEFSKLTFERQK